MNHSPAGPARTALIALFAGSAGIAFAPIFVRLSPVGPSATAFYRILIALPILWAWMHFEAAGKTQAARPRTSAEFGALALAGLFSRATSRSGIGRSASRRWRMPRCWRTSRRCS